MVRRGRARSAPTTDQATDTIGTATTAPITPARMPPAMTDRATTTGCSRTAQLSTSGCSTCPSIWPTTTIRARTRSATTGPREASATTVATASAMGEPTSGMNAAKNSSRVSGSASGTRSANRAIPTSTALTAATTMMPRVYPANVRHAACPARLHGSRTPSGSRPWNQCQNLSPE